MTLSNRPARTLPQRCLHTSVLLIAMSLSSLTLGRPAAAQEASSLTVEAVTVEPASPGPDTLCKLTVKVANGGDRTASQLDFQVKINGQELPVYRNQLFMFPVSAGETVDIPLYNFWSTETSRPAPADGKLAIEVTLRRLSGRRSRMKTASRSGGPSVQWRAYRLPSHWPCR